MVKVTGSAWVSISIECHLTDDDDDNDGDDDDDDDDDDGDKKKIFYENLFPSTMCRHCNTMISTKKWNKKQSSGYRTTFVHFDS